MPRGMVIRMGALVACAFVAGACVQVSGSEVGVAVPLPVAPGLESRTVDYVVPDRPGQLTRAQVDSLAPRVQALRAEPAVLRRAVGDTLRMAESVRVYALDSAGVVLGELPGYDFSFSGRGMRLLADGRFLLSRTGTMRFTARFPEQYWRGRRGEQPAATVTIVVDATAGGAVP